MIHLSDTSPKVKSRNFSIGQNIAKFGGAYTGNLYQLYSYLGNIESKPGHSCNPTCEGVLLYPTVNYFWDETFEIGSHLLKIKTLDLDTNWQNIKKELLETIK